MKRSLRITRLLRTPSFLDYVKPNEEPYVPKNVKPDEEPYVPENVREAGEQDGGGTGTVPGSSTDQATLQLMAKMMEGMTNLQRQILENKESEGDAETVRGQEELPALPEWSASSGPVDLSDSLAMIERLVNGIVSTLRLPPIERVSHEASPSEELNQARWTRLERRVSSMLLMAVPQTVREEPVASKRMTALKILCQLMVQY